MGRSQLHITRKIRAGQRQFETLGQQTEKGIDRHVFKRFARLAYVQRFVAGWLLLVVLLIAVLIGQNLALSDYYQTVRAVPGGIYNEGVLGTFSNANPLYATNDADTTVSQLIFAGLFSYDDSGKLVGDLASSYEVNQKGDTYTVHLKPNLTWHDSKPVTSEDVLYTYQAIQNPDAQSPLESSWRGITITAPDKQTVVFKLPDPLASFPYTMTNGIVPKHILGNVPPQDLRSADFNTAKPVGAGPFRWQAIQVSGGDASKTRAQIAMLPFEHYQGGKPKLQEFVVHAYASQDALIQAFQKRELTAVAGLPSLPAHQTFSSDVQQHSMLLRAETMVFFKVSSGVLSEPTVRQALVQGANVPDIIRRLGYPTRIVREPLLTGQASYDPASVQAAFDTAAAQKTLDAAGWKLGAHNVRIKDGRPLTFTLTAPDTAEYRMVASQLQKQWQGIGVRLQTQMQQPADFQTTLNFHSYEAILYGISIGVDPDVFVYWDSSQADVRSSNRLNLSEYKNTAVDAALESGRTRLDPSLRSVKYKPFLQNWQKDAPALGLYQPRVLYLTNGSVDGLNDTTVNKATDRFTNVQNWQIRQGKVTN